MKKFFDTVSRLAGVLALVLILVFSAWLFTGPTQAPVARSYSVPVYIEQGGEKLVIESGGELEAQSGAVVDLQGGATITMPSATYTGTVTAEQLTSTDDATINDVLTAYGLTLNGNATITGTTDLQGDIANSTGDVTIADNTDVTGTLTAGGFTLGSTSISATGDELNAVAGLPVSVTFAIGAEITDTITVTTQLLDANGDDEVSSSSLWAFLSGDSGGVGIVGSAPSGGIAGGTDGTFVAEPVDNKLILAESESDGDLDFVLTEAGDNSFYLVVILPNGRRVVSNEIDFD